MNVMKRAWEIAKQGAAKFGGSAKEYLAEALKLAWVQHKRRKEVEANEIAFKNLYRAYKIDEVLPELKGSEKQVKWANDIRYCFIENVKNQIHALVHNKKVNGENAAAKFNPIVRWAVENKLEASYWINLHQNSEDAMAMLRKVNAESGIVKRSA